MTARAKTTATITCRACGGSNAISAKRCARCGEPISTLSPRDWSTPSQARRQILINVAVLVCLALVASAFVAYRSQQSAREAFVETARCRQDVSCWGGRHLASASVRCAPDIERMAKYAFEWIDGVRDTKFSRFRWADEDAGIVTYIGDAIRLQNGFGAWSPHQYACDFDTLHGRALDVRLSQGRLPAR